MAWGRPIFVAMALVVAAAAAHAGEAVSYGDSADGLTSLRKNAVVGIGGEIRVDYAYRTSKSHDVQPAAADPGIDARGGDLSIRNANIRITADVHPNVRALLKIDLSSNSEKYRGSDEILEEALVVMRAVGGTGLEFFAGKGRAPYGQDVTLGMIQSYHHTANQSESSEGPVLINLPPEIAPGGTVSLPPMRPGQFDRAYLAGVAYEWDERWRVEAAMFQPNDSEYSRRLADRRTSETGSDIGAAARVWWRPFEDLTLEFSMLLARSNEMSRTQLRTDIMPGASGRNLAKAVSAGFDWRRGPWRVFGEYQHGWDWNFTRGYDTDTWQVGAARELGSNWRVGGMAEGLHIDHGDTSRTRDDYYKLSLNVRYTFTSGFFILAEYGHEWFRREQRHGFREKRHGNFIGIRAGLSF